MVKYFPTKVISKDEQCPYNGGYLFLQQIYHQLDIDKVCKEIIEKYKVTLDLNSMLSRPIYGRIIFPCSKHATYKLSTKL